MSEHPYAEDRLTVHQVCAGRLVTTNNVTESGTIDRNVSQNYSGINIMDTKAVPPAPLTEHRLAAIERCIEQIAGRMDELTKDVLENTRVTHEGRAVIQEIRDLFEMGKTGMRVLNWIGRAFTRFVRWVGWMAAAVAAIMAAVYAITHGGASPK